MSKKLFIFLLVIITIINLAATLTILRERRQARQTEADFPLIEPREARLFRKELNLSAEQLSELEKSHKEFWQAVDTSMYEYSRMRRQLFRAMADSASDRALLDSLIEKMGQAQTEIRRQTVNRLLREKELLSPVQHRQLLKMFMYHIDREFDRPMFKRHFRPGPPDSGDLPPCPWQDSGQGFGRKHNQFHNLNNGGAL